MKCAPRSCGVRAAVGSFSIQMVNQAGTLGVTIIPTHTARPATVSRCREGVSMPASSPKGTTDRLGDCWPIRHGCPGVLSPATVADDVAGGFTARQVGAVRGCDPPVYSREPFSWLRRQAARDGRARNPAIGSRRPLNDVWRQVDGGQASNANLTDASWRMGLRVRLWRRLGAGNALSVTS